MNKLVFELLDSAFSCSILVLLSRKNLLRDDWEALFEKPFELQHAVALCDKNLHFHSGITRLADCSALQDPVSDKRSGSSLCSPDHQNSSWLFSTAP